MTLRTLNYGNYGIFLIMGNAGFCPSAVVVAFITAPKRIPKPGTWESLDLIEKGIHPLRIATGFEKACEAFCCRVKPVQYGGQKKRVEFGGGGGYIIAQL